MGIEKIREKIALLPKKKMARTEQEFVQRYLGSQKKYLGVATGDLVKIAKGVVKEEGSLEISELINLLDELFAADNFEEHAVGGKIFTLLKPETRARIPFVKLEIWIRNAKGWAEIDVICQSSYSGIEVLKNWNEWKKTIHKFSKDSNVSLRRASLVLQTRSAKEANDERIRQMAFETIEKLKSEKDILITKSVSWLLRSLTILDKEEVRNYLLQNETTLPRIAFRETIKKIETGKKTL
ncbi:MAG: DNA alkylation repair protein [Patescibacteria group bacterium]